VRACEKNVRACERMCTREIEWCVRGESMVSAWERVVCGKECGGVIRRRHRIFDMCELEGAWTLPRPKLEAIYARVITGMCVGQRFGASAVSPEPGARGPNLRA
jgi:hypothetical protein